MVDRDLLMPSLGGVQVERAPYSSQTGFLAAFFGGPLAACGYGALNARRIGRLTSDGPWLAAFVVGDIALMWLLAIVMIDLQLTQLLGSALPLLVILSVQVALLACLAYFVTFRLMGRDYEAAVSSAGMIGYGLGATSNAMATMRVMIRRFGPAPRSMLIVPIVGSFLVDFFNAVLTTAALNILK